MCSRDTTFEKWHRRRKVRFFYDETIDSETRRTARWSRRASRTMTRFILFFLGLSPRKLGLLHSPKKAPSARCELRKASRDRSMRPRTDGYPFTIIQSTDEKVSKASKAAKYVKKGAKGKLLKKRFSPTFHRPKTLKNARAPKYPSFGAAAAKARSVPGM